MEIKKSPKSFFKKNKKNLSSQNKNFVKSRETLILKYAVKINFWQKSLATFKKWTKKMSIFHFSIHFSGQKNTYFK